MRFLEKQNCAVYRVTLTSIQIFQEDREELSE